MAKLSADKHKIVCLHRLQEVRLRKYEKQMLEDRNIYRDSESKLRDRINNINNINVEHQQLKRLNCDSEYLSSPIKIDRINIKKYWLNYDLEMHQYYKNIEEEKLESSRVDYNQSKNRWIKEKHKSTLLETVSRSSALTDTEMDE